MMAKSPDEMAASMISNLKEKTGKTLQQWLALVKKTKLAKHREILNYLKSEHGVTHGYANLIAAKTLEGGKPAPADGDLVNAQYSGAKADLRPIYDALIEVVTGFGDDVELSPKKAYVSLRRNKQFAIVQPSTKTRVDVGINLKGQEPTGRLEASGSFNSMVTHRVRVTGVEQVDDELTGWLKAAYDAS
jgi:hypothetical protein